MRSFQPKRRYGRRKRHPLRILTVGSLLFCALLVLWGGTHTTNPHDALALALRHLEHGEFDEAESLIAIARENRDLAGWARLTHALMAERRADTEKALKGYSSITGAAAIDARVAALRLRLAGAGEKPPLEAMEHEIGALENDLRNYRRGDLMPELIYAKALLAGIRSDTRKATDLYFTLRKDYPQSDAAKLARSALIKLTEQSERRSPGRLLTDAELLLSENDPVLALKRVQLARTKSEKGSRQFYRTYLVEERILRKLKRNEEADRLLLLISGEGSAGEADEALLKTAKNAWNINDYHRALEFLGKLKESFPASPLLDESLYIEGRILEEMNSPLEAKDVYLELAEHTKDSLVRVRAFKRVGWLYFLNDDFEHAAAYFAKARSGAAARKKNDPQAFELGEEEFHARYWEAYSISKLEADALKLATLSEKDPRVLMEQLSAVQPRGYYGFLARKFLGEEPFGDRASRESDCPARTPDGLLQRLKAFGDSPYLRTFVQHEIDFALGNISDEQSAPALGRLIENARLSILYGRPDSGISLVESALRNFPDQEKIEPQLEPCYHTLASLSYPRPDERAFAAAAAAANIPAELLYAIARTESYFDPKALSPAGAYGLTQLMPDTAKLEGWNGKDDLFEPEVNLPLGAKHLARLLRQYGGEIAFVAAAYNAGSSAVGRWQARFPNLPSDVWVEMIGYPETNKYAKRVRLGMQIYGERAQAASHRMK